VSVYEESHMSGTGKINGSSPLSYDPYIDDAGAADAGGIQRSAPASEPKAQGPTAEAALGMERDAADDLLRATGGSVGGRRGEPRVPGRGACREEGFTVGSLLAERTAPRARPELPSSITSFVGYFADTSTPAKYLGDEVDIRSDLSRAFEHQTNDGKLRDCGKALDEPRLFKRELRAALEGRGDLSRAQIDDIVDVAFEQLEEAYASAVSHEITDVVQLQCDAALSIINALDTDQWARRAALAEIAALSQGDVKNAEVLLKASGVAPDDATQIAALLIEHASTADAREQLTLGAQGPVVGMIIEEGAFDYMENLLDNALDSNRSNIKQLRRDAGTQKFDHDALLRDDKFAMARGRIFERFDIGGRDGKTRSLNKIVGEHEDWKTAEDVSITILNTAFAFAPGGQITFAGRLGAGMAIGAMGNAPGIAVKQLEVNAARAAVTLDVADSQHLDRSKSARNVAVATAAVQVAAAGAINLATSSPNALEAGVEMTELTYKAGEAMRGFATDGVINFVGYHASP
jgi:hypothetical protein